MSLTGPAQPPPSGTGERATLFVSQVKRDPSTAVEGQPANLHTCPTVSLRGPSPEPTRRSRAAQPAHRRRRDGAVLNPGGLEQPPAPIVRAVIARHRRDGAASVPQLTPHGRNNFGTAAVALARPMDSRIGPVSARPLAVPIGNAPRRAERGRSPRGRTFSTTPCCKRLATHP